jgi:O-antigen/teichoic acid export membrane protein
LGYPPATQWAPALAFATNAALNIYLIPRLGLEGAALATSLSYALWATCITWAYMRAEALGWRDLFALKPAA